jgi:Ca2+-binding EF-hand superfamily protein
MERRLFREFETQLKQKIMQRNATNMHEVQFMAKMFKYFDIANRGKVTFEQFYRAMEKLGVTMSQENL